MILLALRQVASPSGLLAKRRVSAHLQRVSATPAGVRPSPGDPMATPQLFSENLH